MATTIVWELSKGDWNTGVHTLWVNRQVYATFSRLPSPEYGNECWLVRFTDTAAPSIFPNNYSADTLREYVEQRYYGIYES